MAPADEMRIHELIENKQIDQAVKELRTIAEREFASTGALSTATRRLSALCIGSDIRDLEDELRGRKPSA